MPALDYELIEDALEDAVYNLFVYVERSLIKALGIAVHVFDGTDEEKISALQRLVDTDYKTAKRYNVKSKFEWREYEARMRLGRQLDIFEEIFRQCNAPINPLYVITPIVDEVPRILAVTGPGPLNLDDLRGTPLEEPGVMVDYLKAYEKDGHFDMPRHE